MTHCVEPFIQDSVWRWLKANDRYTRVSSEISIGDGPASGRIDLIAESDDGEIHGFEIKDYAFADEQLSRYLESGALDKLYHCSRRGDEVAERLQSGPSFKNNTFDAQKIRKQVSNAIAAGQYTKSEYLERLEATYPVEVLNQPAAIASSLNNRILDEDEKTVRARLTRNLGIPTADFDPAETYISLDEAMERMLLGSNIPERVGVIDVPFSYERTSTVEESFRTVVDEPAADVFAKTRWQGIEICHEADALPREELPVFSRTNEAWVQHHTWWEVGDIREAIVPHPELNAETRIDVMAFEGGDTPTEVFQAGGDGKCIGIEAKGAARLQNSDDFSSIRSQLDQYRSSGALTHLYFAIPRKFLEKGERILSDGFEDIGLITVAESGAVEVRQEPVRREMKFDGYIEVSGKHEYTRSIGFGRLQVANEGDPTAPCRVRTEERRS